jgi:hypothetical protein
MNGYRGLGGVSAGGAIPETLQVDRLTNPKSVDDNTSHVVREIYNARAVLCSHSLVA